MCGHEWFRFSIKNGFYRLKGDCDRIISATQCSMGECNYTDASCGKMVEPGLVWPTFREGTLYHTLLLNVWLASEV